MPTYKILYIDNDDLDIFYKLLIASAVAALVLGPLLLCLLGEGLLGNLGASTNLHPTNVNQNVYYDTQRNNVRTN